MTLAVVRALRAALSTEAAVECDILLIGGMIVDGTGAPGYVGNVAIEGDRIVAVGDFDRDGRPDIESPAIQRSLHDCWGVTVAAPCGLPPSG